MELETLAYYFLERGRPTGVEEEQASKIESTHSHSVFFRKSVDGDREGLLTYDGANGVHVVIRCDGVSSDWIRRSKSGQKGPNVVRAFWGAEAVLPKVA